MKKLIILIVFLLFPMVVSSQTNAIYTAKKIIKKYEGLALKTYSCPARHKTNGWGHLTSSPIGSVITYEIAEANLTTDLNRFVTYVDEKVRPDLEPNKKAALYSFCFNLGKTLKGNLLNNINRGSPKQAADNIMLYSKAKIGDVYKILNGLLKRRKTEATLYEFNYLDFEKLIKA